MYVCLRPVRWFQGVPSPVKNPGAVDMVISGENTEDIYAGLEFEQGSDDNKLFMRLLQENFPAQFSKISFSGNFGYWYQACVTRRHGTPDTFGN